MVTLDLKCQVNIVASKIPVISKSKPPCFFLIWYSLIVLIFNSKTSVFNPKLCISLKYFMCTSITGNCNADFLTRSIRLWGVYAAPAMSCKVAKVKENCFAVTNWTMRVCFWRQIESPLIKISRLLTYQLFSRRLMSSFFWADRVHYRPTEPQFAFINNAVLMVVCMSGFKC